MHIFDEFDKRDKDKQGDVRPIQSLYIKHLYTIYIHIFYHIQSFHATPEGLTF